MEIKILVLIVSYLTGAIPFALVLGKALRGVDVRQHGSGNLGTTNTIRTLGWPIGLLVLAGDAGKGALGAALGLWAGGPEFGLAAGVVAVVGHVFPVFARFRGGKGVATGAGVFLVLMPLAACMALAMFAGALLLGRYVSLASILAALTLAVSATVLGYRGAVLAVVWVVAGFIIFNHRSNIGRLIRGEETRIRLSRKKA